MSIILYGSETWTLTKACSSRSQAFHVWCQRQLMCVRWDDFVTNVYISFVTGLDDMGTILRLRRISFLGHVGRLEHMVPAWKALDLAFRTTNGFLPNPGWRRPGVVHGVLGWTILKKTLLLLSTPWCAWPLIDKLEEVSATVLRRPCVLDNEDDVSSLMT